MENKFYITTAIDYVNAPPHVGHAYEKIITDVISRWNFINGKDVYFLTGTDENAQKNEIAAKKLGMPVKKFIDKNSKIFINLCKNLNLSNNDFIKTTEERHVKTAQLIFKKLYDKGDIYKKDYEGLYCYGCEEFKLEKELVNGKCQEHNDKPKLIKEENYFFKLSKYKGRILKLVSSNDFIVPEKFRQEIISRLKNDDLNDISVSRKGAKWGIDVPIDKNHKIYVWIDALSNYISALDYPNGKNYKKYWPADLHVIGKGINWFHTVIWPAILMSADIKLPKKVLVHGYLTFNGEKISKSLGNSISPDKIIQEYGVDPFRYTLVKDIPLDQDGDFSEKSLKDKINNELANDLGNLVSRTLTLCEKHFKDIKKQKDDKLFSKLNISKINKYFDNYELHHSLEEIWKFVRECNKYVNENKPWENEKNREVVLYNLLEGLRVMSILLWPFIPETSEKINKQLNIKLGNIKDLKFGLIKSYKVKKGDILFKKIK